MTRRDLLAAIGASAAAQETPEPQDKPVQFVCPMDPEVRSSTPAKCPRCGMKLVAGLPDPIEFRLDLKTDPKPLRAGVPGELTFRIDHPKTGKAVRDFEVVHEKLFHLFILSQDLTVFAHEHPVKRFGPEFDFRWTFPRPGMYRLMADYYPKDATPQITVKTLFVAEGPGSPAPELPSNTKVSLETEPASPVAGMRTRLYFTLSPSDDFRQWLGAWGHLLVASRDTVDLIHTHPFIATGSNRMQFNVIFPRPGLHSVWVQFDRGGLVNFHRFDVPVSSL